jgi:ABC-2 type transport system permease protein
MRSISRILAVFSKELAQLRRDRMTFGMVVMIPLIQLILFGYAINTNVRDIPIAVVDQSQTGISRILIQMVEATRVVTVTERLTTPQEAEEAIRSARVRAAFILPDDLTQRLARSPAVGLGTPPSTDQETSRPGCSMDCRRLRYDDRRARSRAFANMPLSEIYRQAPNRSTPTFEVTLFYNPEQRTAVNIVPGLVGTILTMTMIMFTSAAIVRERERGNMEMLINTPVRPIELMIGKIIPYIFIGLVQTASFSVWGTSCSTCRSTAI